MPVTSRYFCRQKCRQTVGSVGTKARSRNFAKHREPLPLLFRDPSRKMAQSISRNIVENPETTDALPDGILLSVWQAQNQLGQTTVYELLKLTKLLGIEPEKVKLGGSKPVTLLVGKSLQVMDKLLAQHLAGKSLPALRAEITVQSELAMQGKMTTAESIHKSGSLMQISDPEPAGPLNVAELLKRLNAASLAQSTGLPLNKAEIEWIMGNRLDTETVKQSRCKIEKRGTKWTIL